MTSVFHTILNAVSAAMEIPVTVILVLFMAFAVYTVGWIIAEFFTERRHMKACLPALLDVLRRERDGLEERIEESALLCRQKQTLLELTHHSEFSPELRAGLAQNLMEKEQAYYDKRLKFSDIASRLAPMFGLLGTLIPLGPGLIALGQGDTLTLSLSLRTAFDTTIVGLLTAAVFLVVSTLRRRWYRAYMTDLETLVDCVLDMEAGK